MASPERIALLKKFLSEQPSDPFNKYALSLEYLGLDERDEASRLLDELLEEHPTYLPTYYQAAHFHWENEEFDRASEIFSKGIDLANAAGDNKAEAELKSAFEVLRFEMDD